MTVICQHWVLKSKHKVKTKGDFDMKGKVLRKDMAETKERIIKVVKFACEGRCNLVNIKESETTDSLYFTIDNGRAQLFFRVSDHPTKQRIKSFTVSKSTKMTSLERYVVSNINRLNRCSLYNILDSLSANFAVA